jgi:hypothetical protein
MRSFCPQVGPAYTIISKLPVVDVLMATAAAPTFFPSVEIQVGSAFVDGGLWANNPIMAGITESIALQDGEARGGAQSFNLASTRALSIGTGRIKRFLKPPTDGPGVLSSLLPLAGTTH